MGYPTLPKHDERQADVDILSHILSQKHLYEDVRERQGLAYESLHVARLYRDHGLGMIQIDTSVEELATAVSSLSGNMKRLLDKPLTRKQLRSAKTAVINAHLVKLSQPNESATALAWEKLLVGHVTDPQHYAEQVHAVKARDVQDVAHETFGTGLSTVVYGPWDKVDPHDALRTQAGKKTTKKKGP